MVDWAKRKQVGEIEMTTFLLTWLCWNIECLHPTHIELGQRERALPKRGFLWGGGSGKLRKKKQEIVGE